MRAVALSVVCLLYAPDAHADELLVGSAIAAGALSVTTAILLAGNAIDLSNGVRPSTNWTVGALLSGSLSAIAGALFVGFGAIVEGVSEGRATDAAAALIAAGVVQYLLGSTTFVVSLVASLMPVTVLPSAIDAGDQTVPALALVAAW